MGGAEGAVIQLPIVNGGGGAEGRGRFYSVTNCKWEGLRGEGAFIQLLIVNGRG